MNSGERALATCKECGESLAEVKSWKIQRKYQVYQVCCQCGTSGPTMDTPEEATERWNALHALRTAGDGAGLREAAQALVDALDVYRGLPLDQGNHHAKADAGREAYAAQEKLRKALAALGGKE
jgi:hypothetical protein